MTAPDSLAARMLTAAETIDELNARLQYGPQSAWAPRSLRDEAEHIAAEDREAAKCDALVEELAQAMYEVSFGPGWLLLDAACSVQYSYVARARELVESGWMKA